MTTLKRLVVPLILTLLPASAHAHLVSTRFGEFYSGLLHPLTTLVHLVPWLALAIFCVMQNKAFVRKTLLLFPLAVGLGVLTGIKLGAHFNIGQFIVALNIASFVVLGGLVALSRHLPQAAGLVLVALLAFCHGYANGDVELAGGGLMLYFSGVVSAAYIVLALVAGVATVLNDQAVWGRIALRAMGSWILAAGMIYGGFTAMGIGGV